MSPSAWLLLTYKVPADPPRARVALWRRIKALGAVYIQGGVCLLPRTEDHLRQLKMIENDVAAAGGECILLVTVALDAAQEAKVVARFRSERDEAYVEFLGRCDAFDAEIAQETADEHFTYAELEENDEDLKKLKGWLARIGSLDFYGAARATEAAARLAHCETLLNGYAQRVFAAHDQNRSSDQPGD